MKDRIRIDTRLLERMEEGRRKPPPKILDRVQRYNKAAASLGLTFEGAVAQGKLSQVTAMAEAQTPSAVE